jgi:ribosomal protein S19
VERLLVQISVIVAIIQTGYGMYKGRATTQPKYVCKALKIVVGKVFLRLAIMQELVGPK